MGEIMDGYEAKMPFKTPQTEYEMFISSSRELSKLGINGNPTVFSQHILQLERLSTRLNYRFLELDSKLRFLRLISEGVDLDSLDLKEQGMLTVGLNNNINDLEAKLDDLKKETRSIRKKVGRCIYQNEVKRCVEGKEKLETELEELKDEIKSLQNWFIEHGIINNSEENAIGFLIDNKLPNVNNIFNDPEYALEDILKEQQSLKSENLNLESQHNQLQANCELVAEEINELKRQYKSQQLKLNEIDTQRKSLDKNEIQKIEQINELKTLVGLWNKLV